MSELSVRWPFNCLLCSLLVTSDGGNAEKPFTLLEFGTHFVSKFNSLGAPSSFLHDIKLQFIQQECKKRLVVLIYFANTKMTISYQLNSHIAISLEVLWSVFKWKA